jgi:hypothetical protein
VARAPTSAAAPVRSCGGILTWLRAIGRTNSAAAAEPTTKQLDDGARAEPGEERGCERRHDEQRGDEQSRREQLDTRERHREQHPDGPGRHVERMLLGAAAAASPRAGLHLGQHTARWPEALAS